jgi:hypothetical protein
MESFFNISAVQRRVSSAPSVAWIILSPSIWRRGLAVAQELSYLFWVISGSRIPSESFQGIGCDCFVLVRLCPVLV